MLRVGRKIRRVRVSVPKPSLLLECSLVSETTLYVLVVGVAYSPSIAPRTFALVFGLLECDLLDSLFRPASAGASLLACPCSKELRVTLGEFNGSLLSGNNGLELTKYGTSWRNVVTLHMCTKCYRLGRRYLMLFERIESESQRPRSYAMPWVN